MICDKCGEHFAVCPNAPPRQWAMMAVAFTLVAAVLMLLAFTAWSLAAALHATVETGHKRIAPQPATALCLMVDRTRGRGEFNRYPSQECAI